MRPPAAKTRIVVASEPGYAGVKRHVVDILENIDTTQFEVLFLYSLDRKDAHYENEIDRIRRRGIRAKEVRMVRSISPLRDLAALLQIYSAIRAFRPEVVHVHSSKAGFLGRIAAKAVSWNIRTVYTPNLMSCYYGRHFLWLEKLVAAFTDRVIAVSNSEGEDIRGWGVVPAHKIEVIPMCVRRHYPLLQTVPNQNRRLKITACGRICFQKNALLFFKVAVRVLREHPEVSFVWIGDFGEDHEAASVRRFIATDPRAQCISVTGWVEDPDKEIASSDIFCMFSRFESFGFVTVDAMMMGVPVVGTRATGTVDLIRDGETGFIVPPDEALLAGKLIELIENPKLRHTIGQQGREHICATFTIDRMIREIETSYCRMVATE
jgi:glycosyltransferase involved in cell wall biosynthesis